MGTAKIARIGIIGDFNSDYRWHLATNAALDQAGERAGVRLAYEWVPTDSDCGGVADVLGQFDAYWVAPGSPYRSYEGALDAIKYARESGRPFVAT